jgi:hypothetical protein
MSNRTPNQGELSLAGNSRRALQTAALKKLRAGERLHYRPRCVHEEECSRDGRPFDHLVPREAYARTPQGAIGASAGSLVRSTAKELRDDTAAKHQHLAEQGGGQAIQTGESLYSDQLFGHHREQLSDYDTRPVDASETGRRLF